MVQSNVQTATSGANGKRLRLIPTSSKAATNAGPCKRPICVSDKENSACSTGAKTAGMARSTYAVKWHVAIS